VHSSHFSVGAKEPVAHSGEDESGRTIVNGGDHTTHGQVLNPNSNNQNTHQTGTQDDLRTSNETANGTVNSNEEKVSQQVDN
jgi:hypothetical protein